MEEYKASLKAFTEEQLEYEQYNIQMELFRLQQEFEQLRDLHTIVSMELAFRKGKVRTKTKEE